MDIGSGTVRVMLCEQRNGSFDRLVVKRTITRLADGFAAGRLAETSMDRTVQAAKEMAKEARAFGAVEIRVSCSGVMRRAENAKEFLMRLRDEAGLDPVLIAGDLEAAISSLGATLELGFADQPFVLLDIGGFSTELAAIVAGKAETSVSVDVGSVSMRADYLHEDPPTDKQLAACAERVGQELRAAVRIEDLGDHGPLVGTAGSITNLAAMSLKMERYEPGRLNRAVLTVENVQELLSLLISMPAAGRLSLPGLEKGREDTIVAGAIIALEVMKLLQVERMLVTEGGVLEGLAVYAQWPPDEGGLLTV
ncbi:MAG: ethanolamine ammonia-lyase reactivating factor EutA [Candidatus Lernaella stagnicola]|nr:ethanolamine ammonia-lyase reactivating factor EutA [Candidatus Lernaella stagnicola]